MAKEGKTLFDIDRAIKVALRLYPEKCLDLFFGKERQVIFQGVEDPQINIAERRADKVWLVSEHGQDGALHIEAILEPKKSELPGFYVKNALLEAVLKRPVITVLVYLEKGKYETFPNAYERSIGLFKNTYIFASILLWEYLECILSGEYKEFAPLVSLLEENPTVDTLEKEKELIAQLPEEEQPELMGVAILVACRKFKDELVRQIFKEKLPMVKEISFVREWIEEGEQKGREEGEKRLLLRLLAKKFGPLSAELQDQINLLSGAKLDNLSLAIFDLRDVDELHVWLANGTTTPSAN